MFSRHRSLSAGVFLSSMLLASGVAYALESLGTFSWQLSPFCNVLTLTIVADGPIATVSGYDNLCGAGQRQAAVGSAFPNPDGTVGIGLTILSSAAPPSHVQALIGAGGSSGTWKDEGGNSGAFIFNPGSSASGSPRPSAGTKIRRLNFTIPAGFAVGQAVACPTGSYATGGGATGGVGLGVTILLSAPNSKARGLANFPLDGDVPDAWYVLVRNDNTAGSLDAQAYVVCVSP